jgi:cellulose biosynthesis protein BcsQ
MEEQASVPNLVAVINGKGGTGKTSLVANVAGLAAGAGYRVLAVDLDPQGNLSRDLGYAAPRGNLTLFSALAGHSKVQPLFGVRENLDVVPAWEDLEDWSALAGAWRARHRRPETALGAALQPVAGEYHMVLVDCPPGNRDLQLLAMNAARYAVVPTRPDEASLDGLVRVARLFESVRADNAALELLGVVLFGIETRAKRIRADVRAKIGREVGDADLVFDAEIRHVLAPALGARGRGLLAHEYEAKVLAAPKFWERLRQRDGTDPQAGEDPEEQVGRLAASAPGLAEDYQAVASELLTRMQVANDRSAVPA